jgi:hypothetical protein
MNIEIYQGDSRDIFFRVKRKVSSNPDSYEYIDVTGCTVLSQIRPSYSSEVVLATFQGTIANQSTSRGGVLLHLDPTVTSSLLPGQAAVWDCQLTFPGGGEVKTFLAGRVTVTPEVSR